eukprot:179220-Amphidinium_carterae.1
MKRTPEMTIAAEVDPCALELWHGLVTVYLQALVAVACPQVGTMRLPIPHVRDRSCRRPLQ